jgi:hypothetical protein
MNKSSEDLMNDYGLMKEDLIKILTIFIVSNLIMFISDPTSNKLFGESYIKLMSVVVLGIITYWLIIKNLI